MGAHPGPVRPKCPARIVLAALAGCLVLLARGPGNPRPASAGPASDQPTSLPALPSTIDWSRVTSRPTSQPTKDWVAHEGSDFAIYIPRTWRKTRIPFGQTAMYVNGDGIAGPMFDETRKPLQIGLQVDRGEKTDQTPAQLARAHLKALDHNKRTRRLNAGSVRHILLADSTRAALLTVDTADGRFRKTRSIKLFAVDGKGREWTASAWITHGQDSTFAEDNPKLVGILTAYVASLSFDARRLDDAPLRWASRGQRLMLTTTQPSQPTSQPATRPADRARPGQS